MEGERECWLYDLYISHRTLGSAVGKDFSSLSCHSKPLPHLLGLAEVLCHLPRKTEVKGDTRICEKGRFC